MNEGPTETVADKAEPKDPIQETIDMFPDMDFAGMGHPQDDEGGEPQEPEAVEQSEDADKPAEPEETPEAKEPDEGTEDADPEVEEKAPESEATINFDGLSDASKAYWEKAVREGWGTAEDVDRARHESMFQSTFTKKTTALAEERKAFAEEQQAWREQNAADAKNLDLIKSNPQWREAWTYLSEHGIPKNGEISETGDPDGDDLIDRKTAERMVEQRIAARDKEREERTLKQEREYKEKALSIGKSVHEFMEEFTVDKETAKKYMAALQAEVPVGDDGVQVDPVLHYDPLALRKDLVAAHEKAQLQARVDKLEAALEQKASKAARTTKQSQPPPSRIETRGKKSAVQLLNEQLGLNGDWSNVAGWGHEG